MEKLNKFSKYAYIIYLFYHIVYILILFGSIQLLNNFKYKFFLINFTGEIALIMMLIHFLTYNILIFIFVYKYCVEKELPGYLWLIIVLLVPNYLGLIAFIAIRYQDQTKRVYSYLTLPGYDTNKEKCDKCGKYINSNDEICPYCGDQLVNICTKCGHKVKKAYLYCDHCGYENKK